ncbi:MAG: ATP-binding cassette domain-containing protein [Candidatus Nanopelagicales bacterium]|nr:ATP-binding cassette domain-containing protein [Candidatus Nanopelagicales bacterium]
MTIRLEDVVLVRGTQTLVNGFSAVFGDRNRVGLFGPNGCGKSSLLAAILGELPLEAGRISLNPPEMTIGYLPQVRELPPDWTVLGALRDRTGVEVAERALEQCASRLASDTSPDAAADYDLALRRFNSLGAASLDERAAAVLTELGADVPLDRTCEGLSGGELARIGLAGIVLSRFDALLLDEPTNDLDEAGLSLLVEFLDDFGGPVLLVSHDRRFLEATITSVVEFDPYLDRVSLFNGGYRAWQRERQRAHTAAIDEAEQYDESVAGLKEQIAASRRQSARGVRTANRAYSEGSVDKLLRNMMIDGATAGAGSVRKVKRQLEQLEKPDSIRKVWNLRLSFPQSRQPPASFTLNDVRLERGEFALGPVSLSINPAERVRIHGPNGSGKSLILDALLRDTLLLNALPGTRPWRDGFTSGSSVARVGVLDQQRSTVPRGATNLAEWFPNAGGMSAADARTLLAKFGLGRDDVDRPMSTLSEGERTRVGLALLAAGETTGLVLDESTNHLDLPAIEQLESALAEYRGTLVLVTHDEAFAEAISFDRTIYLPG